MAHEKRYGYLPTDDDLTKAIYPGVTREELESRCQWWTDTRPIVLNQIDNSLAVRDESAEAIAKAEAQWARNVADNIPGFAVSPFPHMFMIHRQPPWSSQWEPLTEGRFQYAPGGDWVPLGKVKLELIGDKEKWPDVRVYVNDVFDHSQYRDGWSYMEAVKRAAPNKDPHWFDVPNPRVYWPSGNLTYMPCNDRFPIGPWLETLFKGALVSLWGDATVSNWRSDTLRAFLDHHRTFGGAPERFIDYVKSLVLMPPPGFDADLVERMKAWVKSAQMEQDKSKADDPLTRQEVILLHYYRWKGGDTAAEITQGSLQRIAEKYNLDATKLWPLALKARAHDGRAFRTSTPSFKSAARYIAAVLPKLADLPEAVRMATEEMKDAEAEM